MLWSYMISVFERVRERLRFTCVSSGHVCVWPLLWLRCSASVTLSPASYKKQKHIKCPAALNCFGICIWEFWNRKLTLFNSEDLSWKAMEAVFFSVCIVLDEFKEKHLRQSPFSLLSFRKALSNNIFPVGLCLKYREVNRRRVPCFNAGWTADTHPTDAFAVLILLFACQSKSKHTPMQDRPL